MIDKFLLCICGTYPTTLATLRSLSWHVKGHNAVVPTTESNTVSIYDVYLCIFFVTGDFAYDMDEVKHLIVLLLGVGLLTFPVFLLT